MFRLKSGGSNRITLDRKPPKERINLNEIGSENRLQFLRFPNGSKDNTLYNSLKAITEYKDKFYILGEIGGYSPKHYIFEYDLKTGVVENTKKEIPNGQLNETIETSDIISDEKNEVIYIALGAQVWKYDLKTKNISRIANLNALSMQTKLLKKMIIFI